MVGRYRSRSIWYVVRTKPLRERWASENVRRQGALAYLPLISETEPLFPSYLFVGTRGQWRFLRGTYGVMGVVMFGENPAVLSARELSTLRSLEGPDGFVRLPDWKAGRRLPRPGERVEVRSGLFMGSWGLFEGLTGDDRVSVLLDLLGRKTRVQLALRDLGDAAGRR